MSISDLLNIRLNIALANPGAGNELAGYLNGTTPINHTQLESFKRINYANGTALAAGNFTSSGWGSGAALSAIAGTDSSGTVTVTAGTTPSANPTVTLTFADGTFTNPPIVVATLEPGTAGDSNLPIAVTTTATTVVFTLGGTPTASRTYKINWHANSQ